ncbi:MAG: DUF5069 domain-containing protein [Vulcanimicrobiaceae bacterium]
MESLDLNKTAPRSLWAQINGLYMIARTVDKLRATLPGGQTGEYSIAGFSKRMLDHLGIDEDDLRAVVALASNDDDIAAWLRKHTDPARYAEINSFLANRKIGDVSDPVAFRRRYPVAKALPDETRLFDVLDQDDAVFLAR